MRIQVGRYVKRRGLKISRQHVRRRMREMGMKRPGAFIHSVEQRHGRRAALTVCSLVGMVLDRPCILDTLAWRLEHNEIVD